MVSRHTEGLTDRSFANLLYLRDLSSIILHGILVSASMTGIYHPATLFPILEPAHIISQRAIQKSLSLRNDELRIIQRNIKNILSLLTHDTQVSFYQS